MDVIVVGAGSLGSLIGGLLARSHTVTLVGPDSHVARVAADGLEITGEIETTVRPEAVTALSRAAEADLGLVTTKAFDTAGAVETLRPAAVDTVCSLQNGLGNEETLAAGLDATVLAGTCTYGARLAAPGRVECTGVGEVVLGPHEGGRSTAADRVGAAFQAAGVETTVAGDMPRRLWKKLAVNAGINAVTALARVENGSLPDGPGGGPARAAAREAATVAREHGIDLADAAAAEAVDDVATATAKNTSSMHQDVAAGTRTEIDAINGAVVGRADAPVPVNETLTGLVRAWERDRGLRE